jgi:hypothetical protein
MRFAGWIKTYELASGEMAELSLRIDRNCPCGLERADTRRG